MLWKEFKAISVAWIFYFCKDLFQHHRGWLYVLWMCQIHQEQQLLCCGLDLTYVRSPRTLLSLLLHPEPGLFNQQFLSVVHPSHKEHPLMPKLSDIHKYWPCTRLYNAKLICWKNKTFSVNKCTRQCWDTKLTGNKENEDMKTGLQRPSGLGNLSVLHEGPYLETLIQRLGWGGAGNEDGNGNGVRGGGSRLGLGLGLGIDRARDRKYGARDGDSILTGTDGW